MNDLQPFFNHITVLAGLGVFAVEQILKLKVVPVSIANRFPVVTNILLSVVAAVLVAWQTGLSPNTLPEWALTVGVIVLVAAITYNLTFGKSKELPEGE